MLRILGSNKVFCDGLTRRDFMHVCGSRSPGPFPRGSGRGKDGAGWRHEARLRQGQALPCCFICGARQASSIPSTPTRRTGGGSWQPAFHRHVTAWRSHRRDIPSHRPVVAPEYRASLADAFLSGTRNGIRHLGGSTNGYPHGEQASRPATLAIYRVGGRSPRGKNQPRARENSAELWLAVSLRFQTRAIAFRSLWWLPRPCLRHGLVGVSGQGHWGHGVA